jgi:hypothetical protein
MYVCGVENLLEDVEQLEDMMEREGYVLSKIKMLVSQKGTRVHICVMYA